MIVSELNAMSKDYNIKLLLDHIIPPICKGLVIATENGSKESELLKGILEEVTLSKEDILNIMR